MTRVEEGSFTIEFSSSAFVHSELENFLTKIEGKILYHEIESLDSPPVLAGKLKAYYADLEGALDHNIHPHEILDLEASSNVLTGRCHARRGGSIKISNSSF